jgi:hypothetical protein
MLCHVVRDTYLSLCTIHQRPFATPACLRTDDETESNGFKQSINQSVSCGAILTNWRASKSKSTPGAYPELA